MLDGEDAAWMTVTELYEDEIIDRLVLRWGRRLQECNLDAMDVMQETWARALAARSGFAFRGEAAFLGWLTRIANNYVLQQIRRNRIGDKVLYLLGFNFERWSNWGPVDLEARHRRWQRLLGAYNRLTRAQREVVYLTFLEGRSSSEVAGLIGITPEAVAMRRLSALKAFRKHLRSNGSSCFLPSDASLPPPADGSKRDA
jgi:RNA polymerase sigma factor (sigma-70 family)